MRSPRSPRTASSSSGRCWSATRPRSSGSRKTSGPRPSGSSRRGRVAAFTIVVKPDARGGTGVAVARAMVTRSLGFATVLLAGACTGAGVEEFRGVSYDDRHAADVLDVYLPDDGATGRPAVMYIHGGGWSSGNRGHHADHARRLAESGYVAISIDYRLVPDGAYPAAMQDTSCALAFVRAHADEYGLDPARIAVMGYSAGGHLVSLLGVATDEPDFIPDCAAAPAGAPVAPP